MLPIPSRTAIAAFLGCAAMLAVGVGTSSAHATMIAGTGFIALAFALAVTLPLGRRVRRQRLEFAWWLGHGDPSAGGGAVVPSAPFEVRCYIRHRGRRPLVLGRLSPIVPGGAEVVDDDASTLVLDAHARTEFTFRLVAPAAGRVVLHGLSVTLRGPLGLFEVPLYFPNPLAIKVLPRAAKLTSTARVRTGLGLDRSGRSALRRRGGGTELYELRELVSGDPFKSIAWKASARAGKLMVKEVEQEVQETRVLVLDVSGTMRGGLPGSRKLDYAIEIAAIEARRAIEDGDRIGMVTVDGRVLDYVAPRDGTPQMIRIYDALLAATEVVDQDLTDLDDDELVGVVGRYVRNQDGVDFAARAGDDSRWDVASLVRHVKRALEGEEARGEIVAASPTGAILRRFCRSRGIPLPYRPDPRDGKKGPGLADALRRAGGDKRDPSSIVVLTDFDGVGDTDALVSAVKLALAHGHAVAFVVPNAASFAPVAKDELERDLFTVYGRGEGRRVAIARAMFGRLGVPVVVAGRQDAPGLAVDRAERRRRVA